MVDTEPGSNSSKATFGDPRVVHADEEEVNAVVRAAFARDRPRVKGNGGRALQKTLRWHSSSKGSVVAPEGPQKAPQESLMQLPRKPRLGSRESRDCPSEVYAVGAVCVKFIYGPKIPKKAPKTERLRKNALRV